MYRPDQTDQDAQLTARHSTNLRPDTVIKQWDEAIKPPVIPGNVSWIDLSKISSKDYPLFEKFFEFVTEINTIIDRETFDTLTADPENWGTERKKILDKLKSLKLDQPHFRIVSRDQLPKVAKEINFPLDEDSPAVKKNKWFCIFNLPKAVDKFWRKGAVSHAGGFPLEKQIINWGEIYEKAIAQVWGRMDESQSATSLTLDRLNSIGEHEFGKYYYVWGIRLGLTKSA